MSDEPTIPIPVSAIAWLIGAAGREGIEGETRQAIENLRVLALAAGRATITAESLEPSGEQPS